MASIEERLDREDWDPVPGDQIVGEITAISARTGKSEKPYPVLVVRGGDGVEHIVSCALMAADVIAHRPQTGERVGVRFWGPQPRSDGDGTWDKYTIAFEKETAAQIDWDAMAQARGIAARNGKPAAPAAAAPAAATTAASQAEDPWTADTGTAPRAPDEPPF